MKNSILGKARWLRDVALATSKNNGARVAREWLKYAAMFVMLLTLGIGNVWGADYSKNESWNFGTSGNANWSGHSSGYCGGCGSKSSTFNVYKTNISNFSAVNFSNHENVSLTIYVKAGTNSGKNSYTVKLIDSSGNQVSTYSITKTNGMGTGSNASSAKESSVTFTPTVAFAGYKVEFQDKGFITQTRYVLTYDDKVDDTKTYHEWDGSNQFTTSTGGSTLKAVPSLCEWAIEPFGWCSEENYASSIYPTDKIWTKEGDDWPAGETDLYALYRVGSNPYYYSTKPTIYTITYNLTNVTKDNEQSYSCMSDMADKVGMSNFYGYFKPDAGYTLDASCISITMGGSPVNSSNYSWNTEYSYPGHDYTAELYMENITGNVVVTVTGKSCTQLADATGLAVENPSSSDATKVKFTWTLGAGTSTNAAKQVFTLTKVGGASQSKDLTKTIKSGTVALSSLSDGTYNWSIQAIGDGVTYCDGNVVEGPSFTICTKDVSAVTPTVNATTSITKTGATANWAAVSDADHYTVKVYQGTTVAGDPVKTYDNVTSTSQAITGLTANTDYIITVQAHDACGHNSVVGSGGQFKTQNLTLYTVTFHNAAGSVPSAVTQTAEGGTVSIPNTTACEGWTFVGWKVDGSQDEVTSDPTGSGTWITSVSWPKSYTPTGNIDAYAVFSKTEGGGVAVTDELTLSTTGVSGTSYTEWSGKTATSSAVYAGQSAGGNSSIQLRSNNSNSGIIQTASGGNVTKVAVEWNTNSASGRTINIYGKNSAYSAATDLYDNAKQGTLIGTIVCGTSTEITIDNDYAFIGIRSASGALYLDKVSITIGGGGATTWRSDPPCSTAKLDHITITTPPTTTNYLVGQVFSSAGAVVTAYYDDESHHEVTASWTPTTPLTAGTGKTVMASYTEGGVTKTATTTINVYAVTLQKKDENNADIASTPPTVSCSVAALSASETGNSYKFKEWQISGASLDDASSLTPNIINVTGEVTVTAVYWKPITVTWYVSGSGSSNIYHTDTHAHGWSLMYPSNPDPDDYGCTGKVFYGWTTEANKNYEHATVAPSLVSSGTAINENSKFYAVFAESSGGGGVTTTWVKTALSSVTEGIYALATTDGHAFNGTMDNHHGQVTAQAFSFTDGVATSAPAGTCEITFTAVTGGFTMYNATYGYLYAAAAATKNLYWHATETSYWKYASTNWTYNANSAFLRSYSNNSLRTYGANNGDVLVLVKKTTSGSEPTYTNFATSCGCEEYSFHTGSSTDETLKTTNIQTCFENHPSDANQRIISDYVIPSDTKFFVGKLGYFYDSNLNISGTGSQSVIKQFGAANADNGLYLNYTKGYGDGSRPGVGQATGAIGTLYIDVTSTWHNLHLGFDPNGYIFKLGSTYLTMHNATSGLDATRYKETDVVTLSSTNISGQFQVNIAAVAPNASTGVACAYTETKNLTTMGVKSGSGNNWRGSSINAGVDTDTKGFFRIDIGEGNATNWNAHWVPCWELKFDLKGGTGTIVTTPEYVSVEAASKVVTIPTTAPTKDGYRFMGWSDADDNTVEYAAGLTHNVTLSGNKTVYAVWKQEFTVSYAYAGGSGSCAGGSYIEGETVTTCATATKAGSTLTGWTRSDNSATVTKGNTFTMPASNVTLTAVWVDTPYTLTQNIGSHTTKGYTTATIKSGDLASSGLDLTYTISDNAYALPKAVTITGGGQTWTLGTNYTWSLSADKHNATLHIGADLTISADVIITVTEQARYTVVWDEHGNTTTDYYAADDNSVTMKSGIADCGEKKFYGWTEDAEFVSNPTTPPTMASSGAISSNKHYYAIFADAVEPVNPGYVKITSGATAGTYIIVTDGGIAYAGRDGSNDRGTYTTGLTISDGVIASKGSATEVTVTMSGSNFYMNDGTYYLGYSGSSNDLKFDASKQDGSKDLWKLDVNGQIESVNVPGRKLEYNSGNPRFACYTGSGVDAFLFKKQTTTYSNFAKTCTLYDIEITIPSGGEVTTTPAAGTGVAGEGQTVTVNVTPNSCKYLSALKYNDGSDHAISIASTPYTFTMPASDVTVTATFADKSVSSISANTATHRTLMQNTSFEGEQIRVTYNNGETEDLAWNDASLTFSGYNMSTLGEQTVSVAYSGSCGSANTSYSIEITDGIPVTFSDCGITTVRKYEPGDVVPVETTAGEYACAGWEFVGWSESSVAANSTSFTPVRNFNASTARTLYAVYANVRTDWISAFNTSELRGGATYVIVYRGYSYDYALLNTVASTNYLNGQQLATACSTITEPGSPSKDRYVLEVTPTAPMKWQLVPNGDYYSLYNAATNKYLKITTDQHALLTSSCEDKFTIANGYNDSQLSLKSFNASASDYYLYWYNSSRYFEGWTTAQGLFLLTNVETFSSNPPCAPQSAVFHGNGGTVIADGGSPIGGDLTIREATRDAGITTPTAEYEDCDGKSWSFIGWADHEVDVTRVPVLTTDLLNDGGGNKPHTIATDGEEFWAVYTNQGEPMTQYGTISFSMSDIRLDYHTDETEVTKTVPAMGDYTFGYKRVGHQSNTGIQLESGTGEFYNKTSLGRVNAISFNTFVVGGVNNLKVYVGDAEKSTTYELTAAELQVVGTTYTYYPSHNCEYVYIKNYNSYVCVEGISIEFGKGTKVWATTPDCKRVTLSGDIYATSTNGRGIMAVTPLRVNAYQLDPSAGIVITSNSSDVYFSTDRNANFAKAAANQPKTSVTVNAGLDGNLSKDIYVHYKPSSVGDGIPADVMVSANLAIPDPGVTASHPIHVRNLPEKFVIAAKVGATWYALPADMNAETNPSGVVIEVDETNMTATAPNTCSYTIWPVKTTNGEYDRYAINTAHYDGNAFGERVRFSAINNGNKGLWANNATSGNGIRNYAAITSTSDGGTTENTNPSYEWIITTTVADGQWQYTLQTDQTQNNRYLRYWSAAAGGPKWGTYASGEQNLYFLPVTEVEPFEMQVVEWYPTKVLIQTDAALASPTVKVNSEAVASPVLTTKGGKLWEISGLPLESNPTKSMTVAFTADEKNYACTKTVPIIISRGTKTQADAPFATLGAAIYTKSDVVVRDGAVLTVNGSNAANTFNDVTIYPTSKISVPSEKKLTVHALTFFGGIDEIYDGSAYAINKYGVPELSLKGTLHKSIAQIDYVMRVDDSQMYSLTVPYDVNLADITYWDGTNMGTPGDKLWVSAYDGDARAKKDMSHTWIWEANFASKGLEEKLKAGVGYTISAGLQAGVGSTYSILRMPMASNVANDGTELAKTVPVVAHGINSDVSDNHKGWNLVGNPYMVAISGAEADSKLVVGYLKETGTGPWEWVDTYRYVTIPNDNGTDYYQAKFSSATLKPFKNFFLQIATSGDLSFALASRQNSPARYLEAQKREVEFEINLANGSHEDHTGLLIAEQYSPAYEINADLEKMIGSMSVYTIYGGYNLAYNALSPDDAKQFIPIGYVAPSAGEYTFSLDDNSDVNEIDHIYLTDYQESVTVDLMEQDYIFMTTSGKNESRFAINATLKEETDTPTDIDIINGGGDLNADAPQKFIYHDKMYILRNGVLYDATGKKVK